ncbi:MAG TPA: endonuclease/exonuclease/phosphatase family protein [Rudaea sp.]
MRALRIASYNVHGGVGMDRRFSPQRIARVLREIDADVVALQELRSFDSGVNLLELLRDELHCNALAGPTMRLPDGDFGNGLLSRFPIVAARTLDLSIAGREPRRAIDATLDVDGAALRVIATHLGLRARERHLQFERLLAAVPSGDGAPTLLLGDVNEWFAGRRALRRMHRHFGESPARATFPAALPLLALDRIWCSPELTLRRVHAHRSRLARVASDHLPLVAQVAAR